MACDRANPARGCVDVKLASDSLGWAAGGDRLVEEVGVCVFLGVFRLFNKGFCVILYVFVIIFLLKRFLFRF